MPGPRMADHPGYLAAPCLWRGAPGPPTASWRECRTDSARPSRPLAPNRTMMARMWVWSRSRLRMQVVEEKAASLTNICNTEQLVTYPNNHPIQWLRTVTLCLRSPSGKSCIFRCNNCLSYCRHMHSNSLRDGERIKRIFLWLLSLYYFFSKENPNRSPLAPSSTIPLVA